MDENLKAVEMLLDQAVDYGKTGIKLARLKSVEKVTEAISLIVPWSVILILVASFLLFLNLAFAFWIGDILGKVFYGFLIIAGINGLGGITLHFFLHKWFKRVVSNYFIKALLK